MVRFPNRASDSQAITTSGGHDKRINAPTATPIAKIDAAKMQQYCLALAILGLRMKVFPHSAVVLLCTATLLLKDNETCIGNRLPMMFKDRF